MGYKFNIFTRKLDRVGVDSIVAGTGVTVDTTDPSNPVISSSSVAPGLVNNTNVQSTGVTTEIVLAVISVPIGTFKVNDALSLYSLWGSSNSASTKNYRAYVSSKPQTVSAVYDSTGVSTVFMATTATTSTLTGGVLIEMCFTGALNSLQKIGGGGTITPTGSSTIARVIIPNDFTSQQYIVITGQLANAADTINHYFTRIAIIRQS